MANIIVFFFLISIIGSTGVFLWFLFYNVIWGSLKGAPFVPSQKDKIQTMLELAEISPGDVCYDLGSGNGAILFPAAKQGAIARGVEVNPFLARYTRYKAKKLELSQVSVKQADFRTIALHDADVVFLYLWPSTNAELREKLAQELKPGTRVISNAFPIEGWTPEQIKNGIFRYRIS